MSTTIRRFMDQLRGENNQYTITIVGFGNSGKTTLLYLLKLNEVVQTIPSIGFNVESVAISLLSGKWLQFTGWDVGTGCGDFKILSTTITTYSAAADALIWVVDSTDLDGLQECVETFNDVAKGFEARRSKAGAAGNNYPILILANKQDLPGAQSIDAIRKAFAKVLQGRNACIFKSSLTRPMATSGLPDAFEWLSIALEMESSGKPAYTPRADPVTDLRSSDSLTETLESWLDRTESTLQEFIYQFSSFTLPAWDHYAHIRITFVLLTTHGRQRGKDLIFDGIERYIAESSQTRGRTFHFTMTYFWIQIVHLGIQSITSRTPSDSSKTSHSNSTSPNDFSSFLLRNPYVVDGNLWTDYYSKDVIMSLAAKTAMVLPDRKPLPNLVIRDAI